VARVRLDGATVVEVPHASFHVGSAGDEQISELGLD
jgi:hypothetical protein